MKISFCGDVCPSLVNDIWKGGKTEELFHDVSTAFQGVDRVIVNLECSLTEADTPIQKVGPNMKASPLCAKILKKLGVTDCAISNNHIFDFGVAGVRDTIRAIEEVGLGITGFGENAQLARKNLIVKKDGISVAIINVCEHEYCYALSDRMGARGFDAFDTMEDIRQATQEHDYVVVLYHGGKEQSIYPSPRLRKQSQAMVKNGASMVLCQHSHCIGCYEKYMGGHILYGQGNFHFLGLNSEHPHWQSGLIVQAEIGKEFEIEFVPVQAVQNGIQLANEKEAEKIMQAFEKQSMDLQTDAWEQGWKEFCEENRTNYMGIIGNAYTENATAGHNEMFAHYLYCESHRDVWEELCKLSWETRLEP